MKHLEDDQYLHLSHTFQPVFNQSSRILILGTFPSVKSRENQFFYGHPQNRFWRLLAFLLREEVPLNVEEKKKLLLRNHMAVWDVIAECDIIGSSDSSIKNVVPTDISEILQCADIQAVFANGAKAYQLYQRYTLPLTNYPIFKLPSTSPANAAYQMERLAEEWKEILQYI